MQIASIELRRHNNRCQRDNHDDSDDDIAADLASRFHGFQSSRLLGPALHIGLLALFLPELFDLRILRIEGCAAVRAGRQLAVFPHESAAGAAVRAYKLNRILFPLCLRLFFFSVSFSLMEFQRQAVRIGKESHLSAGKGIGSDGFALDSL